MKLSDYLMNFLAQHGASYVFMLPGGGCMHLVDSLGRENRLHYIPCLHEQAASIAAESYAQNTGTLGVVLVTTGPGGTNAITGLAAAWIDSTPVLFLSGQVKRSDRLSSSGVRQMGSQEVDIVPIVKSLTKYAVTLMEPKDIRYELEKALYLAMTGRRGPVWIDIPLDVQAAEIEETSLRGYTPTKEETDVLSEEELKSVEAFIREARRPVLLVGNGARMANKKSLRQLMKKTGFPVLLTWKSIDFLTYDDPQYFGCPGGMGHRYANFILQNSDCLLILGSRLDSSLTAWNHENFAPHARKLMLDIDTHEINKMQMNIDIKLTADLIKALPQLAQRNFDVDKNSLAKWISYCRQMKEKYPPVTADMYGEKNFVNAHAFIEILSDALEPNDVIVPESSGAAGEITYQALRIKHGQRVRNAAGLGSMGFGVPYALGACLAAGKRRTVLIDGDGAFQLNIQELSTIALHHLPIKIFLWMNGGYASIMGTQRNYFKGNFVAANRNSGLAIPDIGAVAAAYGFKVYCIEYTIDVRQVIDHALETDGPVLVLVRTSPRETANPRVKSEKLPNGSMISKPLEDMWPYLPSEEIAENMIERCKNNDY